MLGIFLFILTHELSLFFLGCTHDGQTEPALLLQNYYFYNMHYPGVAANTSAEKNLVWMQYSNGLVVKRSGATRGIDPASGFNGFFATVFQTWDISYHADGTIQFVNQ